LGGHLPVPLKVWPVPLEIWPVPLEIWPDPLDVLPVPLVMQIKQWEHWLCSSISPARIS